MLRFQNRMICALVWAFLIGNVGWVNCSVHKYKGVKFTPRGNAFVVHGGSEGIYSSRSESPSDNGGDSFIRFDKVTFRRPAEYSNFTSGIHVVIFEVEDRETIGGSAYGGQRAVCCTSDLAKLNACPEGKIIYHPSARDSAWPHVFSVPFEENAATTHVRTISIPITRTGMYNLYFMHCDASLRDVTVQGKTVWKNPGGYLPGRMAPLMKFYGAMSLAFVALAAFWFSQYMKFWKEVFALQNCVTAVITLGMFEMALWYFDYAEFNKTGSRPVGITLWAVTFGTIKRTVSRVIILMVSMGFGVVKPTLGGISSKVTMLGVTFFLASETLEVVENVGAVSDLSGKARLVLVMPVALMDAFFIIWIFRSLAATLNKLQARRIMVKLEIYRRFTNALAVAVIVSVGWLCYELYFKSKDAFNERWENAWVIPAFWQLLSFSLLCVICALWAPSQNSMRFGFLLSFCASKLITWLSGFARYAYTSDTGDEFEKDASSLTLIKPSVMMPEEEERMVEVGGEEKKA